MTAESRSVVVRLSAETAQYIREMQKAGVVGEQSMTKVEASSHRSSAALDDVGRSAGRMALGGAAALGLLAGAAIKWESDWTGVTKTVDGSVEQLAALEGGLRGLAKELPASHTEIAGVAEAAGQLGVAREDIVDFTKTMIDLGETTNLTADQAATDIAHITNVMGTGADEVDNLGASLVALGNDGASTEAQILSMAERIAGAGAQIGLAESDILAIANAAASMGIEVEAGGSAISRTFTEMAKATKQGGDDLEAFAQVAGVSSAEFTRAFEADPARAFASFTEGLNRINASGGDVFTTLESLGLSDVRVSQALLGMAASGDLLTDSLDLGSKAWEENTALAKEAEKRYGTTAAQVEISWNKIRDAGIETGESLLPVVAGIADEVGHLADAFGRLPDPVQSSAVHLLAIGTITAGSLWLGASVVSKVTGMRSNLATLAETSPRAARGLGRVATTGPLLLVAAQAMGALVNATTDLGNVINAQDIPRDIEAIAGGQSKDSLDALAGALEGVNEAGAGTVNALFAIPSVLTGIDTSFKTNTDTIEAFDQQLASLVEGGNAEQAAAAFEAIRAAAAEHGGVSDADVVKRFNAYATALENVDESAGGAAEATDSYTRSTRRAADGTEFTAEQVKAASKAYKDARKAAAETATSFLDISEGADDAKVSLREWIAQMEEQAKALEQFTANAVKAADRGLDQGLIKSLEELGPVGALRMKQLADGTDESIGRANAAWKRGQDAVEEYVEATTKVPKELRTKVTVEEAQALADVKKVSVALEGLNDKTIYITTVLRTEHQEIRLGGGNRPGGGGSTPRKQSGGTTPRLLAGGRTPRPGVVPVTVLPTINLTDVDKQGLKDALADFTISVQDGADGVRGSVDQLRDSLLDAGGVWTGNLEAQSQALIRTAEAYDAAASSLADVVAQQQQLVAQVQAQFTHDLFGQGAEFAILQAQADANDAATFQGLLTQLAAQGLDGTAFQMLAASGDIQTAQELLSGGLIDAFEQAIAAQSGNVGSLGSFVGQEAFGTAVREQTAALYTIGRSLESQEAGFTKMVAAVEGVKQSTKDGAYTGTYRGAKDALEGRDARTAAGRR